MASARSPGSTPASIEDELARIMRELQADPRLVVTEAQINPESREGRLERSKETNDVLNYQFWPRRVGMGSLVGRRFIQVRTSKT
jgi:hypothetical protein